MIFRAPASCLALVLAAGSVAAADGEDIHLAAGRNQSLPWTATDGAGYAWSITSYGAIEGASNSGYASGMRLRVNGSYFSWSGMGRMSSSGREVEVGPWTAGALRIWRRIHVDPKLGYCRWIDIFENPSGSDQNASISYQTTAQTSVQLAATTSGSAASSERDWGIVTAYSATSASQPALVHVFAGRRAKVRPRFSYSRGNTSMSCDVTLTVSANATVALCLFEAQRRQFAEATGFLAAFKPGLELEKVPAALRRLILNMRPAPTRVGTFRLPRHEEHDLIVLRNDNELLGSLANDRFVVEAFYKRLELPAQRILGLNVPAADDPYVQVGLVDGQVVAGRLLSGPIRMKLTSGAEMSLPVEKIKTAAFRVSSERPKEIKIGQPVVVLRTGEQLFFERDEPDYPFRTECGELRLSPDDLRAVHLDTPSGGLHRAEFRNGSVLSGLLAAERMKLALPDLDASLDLRRQQVHSFIFDDAPPEVRDDLAKATLRNEDLLVGRLAAEHLTLQTPSERIVVRPAELARLEVQAGMLGQAVVKLHTGTTLTGHLVEETIRFRIEPGPELDLFAGHLVALTCAKAPQAPTTRPAPTPEPPGASSRPAPRGPPEQRPPASEPSAVALAALRDKLKALRDLFDKLQARGGAGDAEAMVRKEIKELEARIKVLSAQVEALRQKQAADR